jgi:hypothetical protein
MRELPASQLLRGTSRTMASRTSSSRTARASSPHHGQRQGLSPLLRGRDRRHGLGPAKPLPPHSARCRTFCLTGAPCGAASEGDTNGIPKTLESPLSARPVEAGVGRHSFTHATSILRLQPVRIPTPGLARHVQAGSDCRGCVALAIPSVRDAIRGKEEPRCLQTGIADDRDDPAVGSAKHLVFARGKAASLCTGATIFSAR